MHSCNAAAADVLRDDPEQMSAVPTYDLPAEAIAQVPLEPRDAARLLVDQGKRAEPRHLTVADLPSLVCPGDVVVVNETKVLPARLRLRKPTGGAVEVLLVQDEGAGTWRALVRPSRKVADGLRLDAGPDLAVVFGPATPTGERLVTLEAADPDAALAHHGEVPLPPYIHAALADPDRYQTVYAQRPGSVAAPTAGLHLTAQVLEGIAAAGATVATVDLAVGLGTFKPVASARVEDHPAHEEAYRVPEATMAACAAGERVIAIGTTAVRALETAAASGELTGRTRLLIHGDYDWRVVDALLTNFHTPRSTLLCLVESFIGPRWRELYAAALAAGYRFLSFGDAMFLERAR